MTGLSSLPAKSRWHLFFDLLSLLRPFTGAVILAAVCAVSAVAAGVGLVATSAYLLSAAALQPSIATLQVSIVGVRFFGLSRGVFRYLERLASHSANFHLLSEVRVWLYTRIEPLSPAGLEDYRSGDLLGHMLSDIQLLENFYVRVISPLVTAMLTALGMGWFFAGLDIHLWFVWLVYAFLLGLFLPWLLVWLGRRPAAQLVSTRAEMESWLVDHLQGLPELSAFNQAGASLGRGAALQSSYDRVQKQLGWFKAVESAGGQLIPGLATLSLLAAAVPMVRVGEINGVVLAVVVMAGLASFEPVLALPAVGRHLETSLTAAQRIDRLANQPVPVPERIELSPVIPPRQTGNHLRIRNLSFRYTPGLPLALDSLDLEIPPGARVALVGPSGSGKTTLLRLLMRFWDYQEGEITLGGIDLRSLPCTWARQQFAWITSRPHLFNTTLRQNLLMACPAASPGELWRALSQAGLASFTGALPDGLDTWIGEGGLRLSAGERQRLGVARGLLQPAPVFLLDEPTANLDAATEQELVRSICEAISPRSSLWITHRLVGMDMFDQVYVLVEGRIVQQGTHSDLAFQPGLYRNMLSAQHLGDL